MLLYRTVRAGAMAVAVSFSTLGCISSGPGDLEGSRFFSFFRTISSVTCMDDSGGVISSLSDISGSSPSGSFTITEENWFARTSACSFSFSVNFPVLVLTRWDMFDRGLVLDLIYFHSFLGFSLLSLAILDSNDISASLIRLVTLFL